MACQAPGAGNPRDGVFARKCVKYHPFTLTLRPDSLYHCALMLMELPASFDPFRAAAEGRVLSGEVATAGLARLADSVLRVLDDRVALELRFGEEAGAKAVVQGRLSVQVELECQRCLSPMPHRLDAVLQLALIRFEAEQEALPEGFESLLVEDDDLDLKALIEDELILALPLVPMHPQTCRVWRDPQGEAEAVEPEKENPFSVLAQLKKDD